MVGQAAHITADFRAKDNTSAAFNKLQNNMEKTQKQAGRLNQQLRFMRGGLGQVGHQVQDIAVQLQMGTDKMLVFGQQGSQIASLFGPQGAVIGAVLAVGAAISVAFSRDVEKGIESLKELREEGIGLADQLGGRLTPAMLEFNRAVREQEKAELAKSLSKGSEDLVDLEEDLRMARVQLEMLSSLPGIDPNTSKEFKEAADRVSELELEQKTLLMQQDVTRASLELLTQGYQKSTDSRLANAQRIIDSANRELDAMVQKAEEEKKLQAQADASANKQVQLRLRAAQASITASNLELDQFIANQKARQEAEQEAIEKERQDVDLRLTYAQQKIAISNRELNAIVEAERKKQEAINKTNQTWSQSLSFVGSATSSIMGMLDEQSGAYKALFLVQQATQIAQAIMSAHAGAANALANLPAPMNIVMSKVILGLGYAQAAAIAGQTIASFEGGGFTGPGVRSGGMDGKGGMLAMLHPNEKVIDMEKSRGGSQAVNVSFNIQANDAQGFDELLYKRRGMITSMVNQALNNSGKRLGR